MRFCEKNHALPVVACEAQTCLQVTNTCSDSFRFFPTQALWGVSANCYQWLQPFCGTFEKCVELCLVGRWLGHCRCGCRLSTAGDYQEDGRTYDETDYCCVVHFDGTTSGLATDLWAFLSEGGKGASWSEILCGMRVIGNRIVRRESDNASGSGTPPHNFVNDLSRKTTISLRNGRNGGSHIADGVELPSSEGSAGQTAISLRNKIRSIFTQHPFKRPPSR